MSFEWNYVKYAENGGHIEFLSAILDYANELFIQIKFKVFQMHDYNRKNHSRS